MRRLIVLATLAFAATAPRLEAASFTFDTDPFAGSTALTTPGRQVVGGESSIAFNVATDVFVLAQSVFGVGDDVLLANSEAGSLPSSGINTVVLRTFDDDNNPATPFAAGSAANLIASQITVPTPGFFIYFNQGLDLPRLVYSTDLNDNTSDLKILFRLTNLTGQAGRDAMAGFTAANFDFAAQDAAAVPEPATLLTLGAGLVMVARRRARRRDQQ